MRLNHAALAVDPPSASQLRLPHKASLVAQTVAVLREEIAAGRWERCLPGEHELCAQLHVSRITLRKALTVLQREKWVRSSQGRRREIVQQRHKPRPSASARVVLLTPAPLQTLQPYAIYWMDCLREHLAEAGNHLEIHASRAAFGPQAARSLQALKDQLHPGGWVLYHSTEQMQRWFAERGLPCVITGSRHGGVPLPSVDIDYRAACRHAAGQFFARGHRHLVLLNPESGAAGDLESEQGFQEAASQRQRDGVRVTIMRHDGSVSGICTKLDLLRQRPERPTAFLVSRPAHVLTVMSHLMRSGLRLPKDAALISRDDDSFLDNMVPTVARYTASPTAFARRISKAVLEMVRANPSSAAEFRLMPQFQPGQTLG